MPLDVGRVTHLLEQMHRSEDDSGNPIAVDMVLVTDGARGFTWETYTVGSSDAILRYGGAAEWYYDHGGTAVGATETIDLADANAHSIVLDVNCTLTFAGAVSSIGGQDVSCSFTLKVIQDSTGGNTITWPASVEWPDGITPTLDTAANAVEILTFWTDDGGTTWYGFHGTGGAAANLSDDTPLVESGSGDAGASTEASRSDHVHPEFGSTGVPPPILLASDHATPFDFGDILQNSEGTDFLWASE